MTEKNGKRLSIYTKDYVVFDLETTGLSPKKDEIIELSAIKVQSGQVTSRFSSLVNPGRHIPATATGINGISDDMVKNAPGLCPILEEFLAFAENNILVGHNIHTFDMRFLTNGVGRELNRKVENDYVDTLYLSKTLLPALPRHRLTDIAAYFHIETAGAHRALNDCIMNQQCYEQLGLLLAQQKNRDSSDQSGLPCPRCGGMLIRRKGRFGAFWGCSGFPQCRYTQNA
ncbi:exonuclease domain-containing protein [Acetatifactor muris]|uniref:DNA polymerase III PolC-type n=1 Tax=Acetatifactor muris TaxID=879566 RepID=A0A2K4ZDB5_9FIRM|nr:exonuclease domain-containing protein [Acetatifactor muris]MCR2046951.1 exonuclease domain-containing protein [Acetatifactor muris]SOY28459.1 DNA polymerase III PolC-type [Acetatifactor muris]